MADGADGRKLSSVEHVSSCNEGAVVKNNSETLPVGQVEDGDVLSLKI